MYHGQLGSGFVRQDSEASKGVVVAPRSGRGDMRARRHYSCKLSFLV